MAANAAKIQRSRQAMSNFRHQRRSHFMPNPGRKAPRPGAGQRPDLTGLAPLLAPLFGDYGFEGLLPPGGPSSPQHRRPVPGLSPPQGGFGMPLGGEETIGFPTMDPESLGPGSPGPSLPEMNERQQGYPTGWEIYNQPVEGTSGTAQQQFDTGNPFMQLDELGPGVPVQPGPAPGQGIFQGKAKRNRITLLNMLRGRPVAPVGGGGT